MSNAERLIEALGGIFAEGETDVDEAAIERMVVALEPLTAPEFSGVMSAMGTVERGFEGTAGLQELWGDWLGTFERVRFEIVGVEQIGENVVTIARQVGTTRHGVDVEQPSAAVWKFREGLLARVEFHLDRDAALASARDRPTRGAT